jgi:hypothetical protein
MAATQTVSDDGSNIAINGAHHQMVLHQATQRTLNVTGIPLDRNFVLKLAFNLTALSKLCSLGDLFTESFVSEPGLPR